MKCECLYREYFTISAYAMPYIQEGQSFTVSCDLCRRIYTVSAGGTANLSASAIGE